MLVQRSLLFIAVPVVGALFLGLLACGPATPSQEEQGQRPTLAAPPATPSQEEQRQPLAAGSAGQEREATETPEPTETETPTSIPTPMPEPTECVTTEDSKGNIHEECSEVTRLPFRPKLTGGAYAFVLDFEEKVKDAEERDAGTAPQIAVPRLMALVIPDYEIEGAATTVEGFLTENNIWYTGGGTDDPQRTFLADLSVTVIQELEKLEEVWEIKGARPPNLN